MKYCYGEGPEGCFYGEFNSRESARAQVAGEPCYTAEVVPATNFLDPETVGDAVLELVEEILSDHIASDQRIIEVGRAASLGHIVIGWLKLNADFTTFGIANVEKHD